MKRFLLLWLLALVSGGVMAYPATSSGASGFEYQTGNNQVYSGLGWFSTAAGACNRQAQQITTTNNNGITYFGIVTGTQTQTAPTSGSIPASSGQSCSIRNPSFPAGCSGQGCFEVANYAIYYRTAQPTYSCPAGGTLSGQTCTCPAGTTDTGTACQANPCPTDHTETLNPTTGWGWVTGFASDGRAIWKGAPGRMAGDGDTAPSPICNGTCLMTPDGAPQDYWIAKTPSATGMARISILQTYRNTGATCSTRSPDLDTTTTASCPGTMGQVNGQTVCLSSSPTTSTGTGGNTDLGTRKMGDTPTSGGTGDGSLGPNGEAGTQPGDVKDGTAGGSTPGTGGGTRTSSGSTVTTTTPDGGTQTFTYGDMTSNKTPGVPVLYERKYDKDPGAYLTSKLDASGGKAKAFFDAAFTPPWSDGGCPKWSLDLGTIGPWSLGGGDVSVPCDVWKFCRIVILITALFLARSLIFGG